MFAESRRMPVCSRAHNVQRREPRYVSTVPVALQRFLRFGPCLTRGVSLEISVRGMSALVCGPPRVGETVVIELPLPDTPIEMLATVRHSNNAMSGFEFYPLSPVAERGLQDWIQEMREHEERLFPLRSA
jgi:c-di-GMP-binding flagellar brake protein YcgR